RQQLSVRRHSWPPRRIGRIVTELGVLGQMMHNIDAKPVHTAVKPETQYLKHRALDFWVAPIEVGLFLQKGVIVILPGLLVPLPRAPAEIGKPIVGRAATGFWIAPNIPVAFCAVARRARIEKPGVLIRRVVGD